MKDQMMSDKKGKEIKSEVVKTPDDFVEKWCVWYRNKEEMLHDLKIVMRHNKIGIRLTKKDVIGI